MALAPPSSDADNVIVTDEMADADAKITDAQTEKARRDWDKVVAARTGWLKCVATAIQAFAPQRETADAVVTGALGICEHKAEEWSYALAESNKTFDTDPYVHARAHVAKEAVDLRASFTGDVMAERAINRK